MATSTDGAIDALRSIMSECEGHRHGQSGYDITLDHIYDCAEVAYDESERLRSERDALAAGLRLVNSMPVVDASDRLGYDCKSCGSALSEPHADDCAWWVAMHVLHPVV
jgi:hypothetical protein